MERCLLYNVHINRLKPFYAEMETDTSVKQQDETATAGGHNNLPLAATNSQCSGRPPARYLHGIQVNALHCLSLSQPSSIQTDILDSHNTRVINTVTIKSL